MSSAQSSAARPMTSGGAKRITVACVSRASTPRATRRSTTVCARTCAGSRSTPAQSPRPRTSRMSGTRRLRPAAGAAVPAGARPGPRCGNQAFVLDHVERFESDCGSEGLPPKVEPWPPASKQVHDDRRAGHENGHRQHAPAERFAQHQPSGRTFSCWSANQRPCCRDRTGSRRATARPGARRTAPRGASNPCGGTSNAGLALYRLDQHRGGIGVDRGVHRGEVSERDGAKARREGPEAVPIIRLRREAHDGRGAPVKIALGDDDVGRTAAGP